MSPVLPEHCETDPVFGTEMTRHRKSVFKELRSHGGIAGERNAGDFWLRDKHSVVGMAMERRPLCSGRGHSPVSRLEMDYTVLIPTPGRFQG